LLSTSSCREALRPTSALYAEDVIWVHELKAISGSSLESPEQEDDTPKGNAAFVGEGMVATGKEETSDRYEEE
jgi:hypothetical protein